jgi:predicted aminopeptidase
MRNMNSIKKRMKLITTFFYLIFYFISFIFLNGCSTITYYSQAIGGQWEILSRSQPIELLTTQSTTPPLLKQQLTEILKIRKFASEVLHLPDNDSYTDYVDLERTSVVWSVFATPKFSFEPKQWCFFIVGCVSYRGYFSKARTQDLAQTLRAQDYDVYVANIPAYSTLGWFDDPVLNTMLAWPLYDIAGLIFHELAHQKIYIKNDTAFNEAFAMTVEYVGVERWLAKYGTPKDIANYQQSRQRRQAFIELILSTRNKLEEIYQQNLSPQKMQQAKKMAFAQLRSQYQQLKTRWGGFAGYDAWFAKDLNNAKLLSIVTYEDDVPAFQALLEQFGGDLLAFYQAVEKLGQLPKEERRKMKGFTKI